MTFKEALYRISSKSPLNIGDIGKALSKYATKYGLTTEARQSAFLANFGHETDRLRSLVEYASGKAYEGRKDLGNIYPGDGVKYKGRGGLMVTGRSNYSDVSHHIFGDKSVLLDNPALLELPENAVISSLYYWKSRGLNELADKGDFKTVVKRINGGLNGWADRLSIFEKMSLAIKNSPISFGSGGAVVVIIIFVLIAVAFIR